VGDVFKEQIVKRASTGLDVVKKIGLGLAVIIVFIVSTMVIGEFALLITVAAGFGAYLLMGNMNVEYEYIFTNGDLDIDAIYNRTRRKRLFSASVSDFEVVAHVEDTAHTRDFDSATETKNYSSGVTTKDTYAFLVAHKGKRLKVIFEPNEMMIKAFSTVLTPRKLFKKQ
jgi:hypothetical protein